MLRDPGSQKDEFESRIVHALQEALDGIDDARVAPISTTSGSDSSVLPPSPHPADAPSASAPLLAPPPAPPGQEPAHTFVSLLPPSHTTVALFFVEAMRNTWSRAARRKAKGKPALVVRTESSPTKPIHPLPATATGIGPQDGTGPSLSCSVRVVRAQLDNTASEVVPIGTNQGARKSTYELQLEFQWVFGKDRALFEAFASHVGRKVTAALSASSRTT